MTVSYEDTGTVVGAAVRHRSHGRWLPVGRAGWAALALITLGLFLAAVPLRYDRLTTPGGELAGAVAHLGLPASAYAAFSIGADGLYLLVSMLIALTLVMRKPDDPMALCVAVFLVSLAGTTSSTIAVLDTRHQSVDTFTTLLGALGYIGLNGLFYLFPTGRYVPRWTWIMLALAVVGQVPFGLPDSSPYNPNSWPAQFKLPLLLGIFGTAIFAQIYRYRRVSDQVQRQQTRWVVFGAIAAILLMFAARSGDAGGPLSTQSVAVMPALRGPLLDLGFCLIPLSLGISMLRYRLWEIDLVISRTLVYGGLTASVVVLYILIVGYLGTVFRTGNSLAVSLVATGVVAVLFQYLRAYLQRAVNRLVYGNRDDPYAVLSEFGKRLETTLAPDAALPTIVQTIAGALKLPYAAITLRQGDHPVEVAACGTPVEPTLTLPLTYGADTVGALVLGLRSGEPYFSPADRRLLEDLARQAGVVVHAARLTTDLQRSRAHLVTAREEERRRLRRDLHDGLGPALGAFSLKIGAARNVLAMDPAAADALLAGLIDDVEEAVRDIRRLVYNLRPPSLDELGLVGALRAQVAHRDTGALQVQVEAPHEPSPLPAAVEVAAFRIAQEALANVVRHADARSCRIRLTRAQTWLEVEIEDDGMGLEAGRPSGVGLISMRERAAEVGGSCTIEPAPSGGTRVRAVLPCAEASAP